MCADLVIFSSTIVGNRKVLEGLTLMLPVANLVNTK